MSKGRVPKVMCQADGFNQVFIASQGARQCPSNLRYFDGMRQPGSEIIALKIDEDLCFVFQAAEGSGVDDSIPIALEGRPVFGLMVKVSAALAVPAAHAIGSKTLILYFLKLLACE
jgi:hypothetical protein